MERKKAQDSCSICRIPMYVFFQLLVAEEKTLDYFYIAIHCGRRCSSADT